jgi:hypothetical protein
MAADCVNLSARPQPASGHGPGAVEHRDWAGPAVWPHHGCDPARLSARPRRNHPARTTARLVARCAAQMRCQTRPQAPQPARAGLLSRPAALGAGLVALAVPPVGPGSGCLDPRSALHHPDHQCADPLKGAERPTSAAPKAIPSAAPGAPRPDAARSPPCFRVPFGYWGVVGRAPVRRSPAPGASAAPHPGAHLRHSIGGPGC